MIIAIGMRVRSKRGTQFRQWATQMFFAEAQNKILYAITGQTAAEIIINRADADKNNMSLTSRKGSIVRKQDIYVAKNYLTEDTRS